MARQYIGGALSSQNVLEVTRSSGRKFTVERVNDTGDPVDWDGIITVEVDTKPTVTVVNAIMATSVAHIRLNSALCDNIKTGQGFRVLYLQNGENIPIPVMVGTFERKDGGAAK